MDGNGRYCYLDPYRGAQLAVAEAARNVACAGAAPIGATNCLNFGNPERPDIMWQLARAIDGIADACRALEIPVTGGNVSLYNETDGEAVHPTPVLGVVGVIEDARRVLGRAFRRAGAAVVLLGDGAPALGGSEYLKRVHGLVRGLPPALDLERERALQRLVADAAAGALIESAHDCAEGGLAVTLAECCFESGGIGVDAAIPGASGGDDMDAAAALFGESASRVVVSVAAGREADLLARAAEAGVGAQPIGRTGGDRCRLTAGGTALIDAAAAELERVWERGLARHFEDEAA